MNNGLHLAEHKRTCCECRHWSRLPANPNNLRENRGECREGPPHATAVIGQGPNGIQPIGQMVEYPKTTPEWPACGHFTPVTVSAH